MDRESPPPNRTTSRTLSLPSSDILLQTSRMYRLHGTEMNGDFEIGVSVQPEHEGTIDDLSLPVYDALSDMAEDAINMDRLRADTTDEKWPIIGMLTISPADENTITLFIEWLPVHFSVPEDESG